MQLLELYSPSIYVDQALLAQLSDCWRQQWPHGFNTDPQQFHHQQAQLLALNQGVAQPGFAPKCCNHSTSDSGLGLVASPQLICQGNRLVEWEVVEEDIECIGVGLDDLVQVGLITVVPL